MINLLLPIAEELAAQFGVEIELVEIALGQALEKHKLYLEFQVSHPSRAAEGETKS